MFAAKRSPKSHVFKTNVNVIIEDALCSLSSFLYEASRTANSIDRSVKYVGEQCGRIARPQYYFYSPTKPISCRNARFGHGRIATNTNARSLRGSIQALFQIPSVW